MDYNYEVVRRLAVLSTSAKGWTKELTLSKVNDGEVKFDIRDWNPDKTKFGKGVRLSNEEILLVIRSVMDELADEELGEDEEEPEVEPEVEPVKKAAPAKKAPAKKEPKAEPVKKTPVKEEPVKPDKSDEFSPEQLAAIAAARALMNKKGE